MRIAELCDGCGQQDADPKLHYAAETYHHDCVPFRVLQDLTTVGVYVGGQYVETPEVSRSEEAEAQATRLVEIVDACKGGLRGEDLLAFITGTGA